MSDLHTDARLLTELVADLDRDVFAYEASETLEADLIAWALLADASRELSRIRDDLAKRLAEAMPEKRTVVEGAGVFESHRKTNRKRWDSEDLLRAVLDTRRGDVDGQTGEIETAQEKILHVWNLGAPRVTALRERGLDPDEFCEVERGDMTLQFTGEVRTEAA